MAAMQDLNDLYFFAQIVEHQGFAAAARVLGTPRSRLSRRLALLEERLGVRLVQRSTRRFAVTEIGHEYYRHCVAMLVEADAAQEAIDRTRAAPQGVVRVACPSAVLYFQVGAMTVSYTHLDVYKRQGQRKGGRAAAVQADVPDVDRGEGPGRAGMAFVIAGDDPQRAGVIGECDGRDVLVEQGLVAGRRVLVLRRQVDPELHHLERAARAGEGLRVQLLVQAARGGRHPMPVARADAAAAA